MATSNRLMALPAFLVSVSKGTYKDGGSDPDYSLKHRKYKDDDDDCMELSLIEEELGYIPNELL